MDDWPYMIRVKDHSPLGYPTAQEGWRERRGRWAAQLIHHHDPVQGCDFLELDFDWHNPAWDGISAILHGVYDWCWQKITKTKTNPYTVAKKRGWV